MTNGNYSIIVEIFLCKTADKIDRKLLTSVRTLIELITADRGQVMEYLLKRGSLTPGDRHYITFYCFPVTPGIYLYYEQYQGN